MQIGNATHYSLTPTQTKAPATSANALTSPVAGTVVTVLIEDGQQVKSGETLLVLEAMKMETEVTAPKDGTVKSVDVAVGDAVQGGQVLVEWDDDPTRQPWSAPVHRALTTVAGSAGQPVPQAAPGGSVLHRGSAFVTGACRHTRTGGDDLPTQAGTVASDGRVAKCVATAQISLPSVSVRHCQNRWRFSEFGH